MTARISASREPIPVNGAPLVLLSHFGWSCCMGPPSVSVSSYFWGLTLCIATYFLRLEVRFKNLSDEFLETLTIPVGRFL